MIYGEIACVNDSPLLMIVLFLALLVKLLKGFREMPFFIVHCLPGPTYPSRRSLFHQGSSIQLIV